MSKEETEFADGEKRSTDVSSVSEKWIVTDRDKSTEENTEESLGEGAEELIEESPGEGAEELIEESPGEGAEEHTEESPGEGAEELMEESLGEDAEKSIEESAEEAAVTVIEEAKEAEDPSKMLEDEFHDGISEEKNQKSEFEEETEPLYSRSELEAMYQDTVQLIVNPINSEYMEILRPVKKRNEFTRLRNRIMLEFPKVKLLCEIEISDREYEILCEYFKKHYFMIKNGIGHSVVDVLFCVALVQTGMRYYDGTFWKHIAGMLGMGEGKTIPQTQREWSGGTFTKTMLGFGKPIFKENETVTNVMMHCFVTDRFAPKFFEYLFQYYELDLERDLSETREEESAYICNNIKNPYGKRKQLLSNYMYLSIRCDLNYCQEMVSELLRLVDQSFWDENTEDRKKCRLTDKFLTWSAESAYFQFEKRQSQQEFSSGKRTKRFRAPQLECDLESAKSVLAFLSRKNVLPKYRFPVDTVELSVWNTKYRNTMELDLQRDLAMAISEYAPGSQIVADGNLITSQYIKKVPNMDWRCFDYIYCDFKTLNIEPHIEYQDENHLKECHVCNAQLDKGRMGTFLIPEFGFESGKVEKAGLIKPKRTFNSEVSYIGYRNDVQYNHFQKGNREYEIAFSQNDEMAVLNQSNFYVCNDCGFTHLSSKGFRSVYLKSHYKSNGTKCGNENLQKYALGYRFETDVIQIRFCWPQIKTYGQAVSVLYGIMKGTCFSLRIEESDIAGCLRYFYNAATKSGSYTIILYDKTPGGAGHVKRLNDPCIFEEVLKEARRIVGECTCGGEQQDTACYNCLKCYSNQRVHDILQRRYVLEFLDDFFNENLGTAENYESLTLLDSQNLITVKAGERKQTEFEMEFEKLLHSFAAYMTERKRFIGLMKDFLYEYPKQMNLMIALYQMGIHEEIEKAAVLNDIFAYRFEKRIMNDLGISKGNASWAVSMWCVAYGKNTL